MKKAHGKDSLHLYRMVDGTASDAASCEKDEKGVLVNKETGVPVALDDDGNPVTLGDEKEDHKEADLRGDRTNPDGSVDRTSGEGSQNIDRE